MDLKDIQTKCFILALFVRDDGERFLLGSGRYEFKDKQRHFAANTMQNDVVEVQGNDGYLLAGQVKRSGSQSFDGYVGDGTTSKQEVEEYRRDFFSFFRKNFFYQVIYIFPDGTAIQRKRGFLVDAPTVQELYQIYPEYHVAINFEDVNYYSYSENDEGVEQYTKSASISLSTGASSGGLVWDSVGAVSEGYQWGDTTTSAGGTEFTAENSLSIPAPIIDMELLGNTTQGSNPTPSAPQAISTVTGEQTATISNGEQSREYKVNLGKNLVDISTAQVSNNRMSLSFSDNTVNYQMTTIAGGTGSGLLLNVNVRKGETYVLKATKTSGVTLANARIGNDFNTSGDYQDINRNDLFTDGAIFTAQNNWPQIRFWVNNSANGGVDTGSFSDIQLELGSTATTYAPYFEPVELCKIGNYQDYIYKGEGEWYLHKEIAKIQSYASQSITTQYLSTTGQLSTGATVYYGAPVTDTKITNTALVEQLEALNKYKLPSGENQVIISPSSGSLAGELQISYYNSADLVGAGFVWEDGGSAGPTTVEVDSIENVYPIWEVQGPATNPQLSVLTTNTTLRYNGTVGASQTLVVDMMNKTAKLNGTSVVGNISGGWVNFTPGNNRVVYTTNNADAKTSTIYWQEVVG